AARARERNWLVIGLHHAHVYEEPGRKRIPKWLSYILWNFFDALSGDGSTVSRLLPAPRPITRRRTAATNVVQTAACRPQIHSCPDTFQDASLNIIGNARRVSFAGPIVFIHCWFNKGEQKTVRGPRVHQRFLARASRTDRASP